MKNAEPEDTPIGRAYAELLRLHGGLLIAGFRDDISDIAEWMCYCRHNAPVPYSFYIQMMCAQVPLPKWSTEQVLAAWDELSGTTDMPNQRRARELVESNFREREKHQANNA